MADARRVNPAELHTLRTRVANSATELENVAFVPASLTSSRRVSEAYDDFAGEWDKRRQKLVEGLTKAADSLGQVATCFEDADSELAQHLSEGSHSGRADPTNPPEDAAADLHTNDTTPGTDPGEYDPTNPPEDASKTAVDGLGGRAEVGSDDEVGGLEQRDSTSADADVDSSISDGALIAGAALGGGALAAIRKATTDDDDPILAEFEKEMGR